MKVSNNFYLEEFIPPEYYDVFSKQRLLQLIDGRIIKMAQFLRDRFGRPLYINTWKDLGDYSQSGLRTYNSRYYSPTSQHTFGRAIDIKFSDISPKEVFEDIVSNYKEYGDSFITTVEDVEYTPTWIHVDCRNVFTKNGVYIVAPKKKL